MARRHYNRRPQNDYYDIQLLNDLHNYFPDLLYNIDRFLSVRDVLIYIRAQARQRYNIFDEAQDEYNNTYYPLPVYTQTPREVLVGGATGRLQAQRQTQTTQAQHQQHQEQQQQRSRFHARGHFQYRAQPRQQQQQQQQQRRADHIRTPITTRFPTVNTPLTTLTPLFDFNTFGLGNGFTTFTTFPATAATTAPSTTATTTQADIDGATALLTLLGLAATTPTIPANLLTPVIVRPSQDVINQATVLETIQDPPPTGICVICQDEYVVGNSVRRIRHCQHLFHNDCIMQHFDSSVRCPTCRHDIRDFLSAPNPNP